MKYILKLYDSRDSNKPKVNHAYAVKTLPTYLYNFSNIRRSCPEIVEWLTASFGDMSKIKCCNRRYYIDTCCVYFKNAADRDWYIMRWS